MRKRYLAMAMSFILACTQLSGAVSVAHAADLIVEESYVEDVHAKDALTEEMHVDEAENLMTAEAELEAFAEAVEEVEFLTNQEELPEEYVSVETEAEEIMTEADAEEEQTEEVSEEQDVISDEAADLNLEEDFITFIEEVDVVPVEVMAEGEEQEFIPEDGTYALDWYYQDEMPCVVRGGEKYIDFSLHFNFVNEHGDEDGYPVENYYLKVQGEYDTDLIKNIEVLDDTILLVTAGDTETGDTSFFVDCYLHPDEEGADPEYVTTKQVDISVMDGYMALRFENEEPLEELFNLMLGEKLDVSVLKPAVYQLFAGKEAAEVTKNISYWLEYDENIWEADDASKAVPVLTRAGCGGTEVRLHASYKGDEFASVGIGISGLDYHAELVYSSYGSREKSVVYTDTPLELKLNTEGLNGLEDYRVLWYVNSELYTDGEAPASDAVEVTADDEKIILAAKEGYDGHNVLINVEVFYDGCSDQDSEDGCRHMLWADEVEVNVRQARVEYNLPEDFPILVGIEEGIGRYRKGEIFDSNHIDGAPFDYEVLGVTVEGIDCDLEDVLEFNEDKQSYITPKEDGFYFTTKGAGQVKFTCKHTAYESDEPEYKEIFMYICGDIYNLNPNYPNDSDQVLLGKTLTIDTSMTKGYYVEPDENGENGGHFSEEIKNYILEVEESTVNTDVISVEVDQDNNLVVTAKGIPEWTNFNVKAFIMDENGEKIEVTNCWFSVSVYGYYRIQLDELEGEFPNPLLGETLDMTSMEPALYAYSHDDTECVPAAENDDIYIKLEYDDNAWRADDPNALIPELTRIGNWETEVHLIAYLESSMDENSEARELTRETYYIGEHDYHADMTVKYGPYNNEQSSIVFAGKGQEQVITLLPSENLENLKGYEVKWHVWDDGNQENDELSKYVSYTISKDGLSLELQGNERYVGRYIHVAAEIIYEENPICYIDVGIDVQQPEYRDNLPGAQTWLPGWEDGIGGERCAYIWDAEYPEGADLPFHIIKVRVENNEAGVISYEIDEENGENYIRPDDNGNFNFRADRYGAVNLILIYSFDEEPDQTYEHVMPLEVSGNTYWLDGTYPNNRDEMRPGTTMEIVTNLNERGYDIDLDEEYDRNNTEYTLVIDEESYDHDLIQAQVQGHSILVTAQEEAGKTDIRAIAVVDGKEVSEYSFRVWVSTYYTQIEPGFTPEVLNNLMPGETLSLEDFGDLKVYAYQALEDGELVKTEVEDVEFFLKDLDMDVWYEDEDGNYIRKQPWETNVPVVARFKNENNDWEEARHEYYIPEPDTWVDVSYSYGGRDTECIYIGEEDLKLTLQTDLPITTVEEYRVEWTVDQYDPEQDKNIPATAVTWEESADGTVLTLKAKEETGDTWINVYADVFYLPVDGEEYGINRTHAGMHISDPVYVLRELGTDWVDMVISEGIFFQSYDEKTDTIQDFVYVENSSAPYGKEIPVILRNLSYSFNDEEIADPVKEGLITLTPDGEGIYMQFMQPGSYTVAMEVKDPDTQRAMDDIVLHIDVHGELCFVEIETDGVTPGAKEGRMLPDESIELKPVLYRAVYDEEAKEVVYEIEEVDFWGFDYNSDMVNVSDEGIVTAAGLNRGWTGIDAVAYIGLDEDNNNNPHEVSRGGVEVEITGAYYIIEPETLYLEPGAGSQELQAAVKKYSITNKNGAVTDERTVKGFSWDDKKAIVENTEDGRVLVNTPLEKAEEPVHVTVSMDAVDEDGTPWAYAEVEVVICSHSRTEKVTTAPTCQAAGEKHVTCTKCGHEWDEEVAKILCISDAGTVTAPTCGKAGVKTYCCTMCKTVMKTEPLAATGNHTYTAKITKNASCKETGTKLHTCSVCGGTKTETLAKTACISDAGVQTKAATCIAAGTKTFKCTVCGKKLKDDPIPKLAGTVTPAASKLNIQLKKSVLASKLVSGLMEGDYIANVTTSNASLVTVKQSGSDWKITGKKVTSKKTGTADITITLASGASAKIAFSVQKAAVKTTNLKVTNAAKKLNLTVGDNLTLETLVKPITTSDKLTFTTSNKKIVTVSKAGALAAKKAGTATITVKSGKKSVKIKVTVKKLAPSSFTLNKTVLNLKVKKSATLKAKFAPSGSEGKVTFKSSNTKIAAVNKTTGKVTAKKKGTVTITATVKSATGETLTQTCTVTVK